MSSVPMIFFETAIRHMREIFAPNMQFHPHDMMLPSPKKGVPRDLLLAGKVWWCANVRTLAPVFGSNTR